MITEFDKNGIAAHFKKKFAECLDNEDYEAAIDYLLKYHDETHNADFHLACGMLYLQMSLDSDDTELLCMAYREFMMHIRRFPDCEKAYRDLLAVLLLRRDITSFVECCRWIKARGLDFHGIMSDLATCGVLFVSPEDDPPEFDMLFAGEYGEIDPDANDTSGDAAAEQAADFADKPGKSKIISFGGNRKSSGADERTAVSADASFEAKIIGMRNGAEIPQQDSAVPTATDDECESDGDDGFDMKIDVDDEFNDFINAYLYGDAYDEADAEELSDELDGRTIGARTVTSEFDGDGLMRDAEDAYEDGDAETALSVLGKIRRGDSRYYFALNMRALIAMEHGDYEESERLLGEAHDIKSDGALGGALLCQLYEYEGKTDLIPGVLKEIDVKDYVNGAHLYKSFDMVLKYCDSADASELLKRYIDEFNIMEMRLVYAQLRYNEGDKEFAKKELYKLSRIFYDDVNARYFYLAARSGAEKFELDTEAPQALLASLVEELMAVMLSGNAADEILDHEVFAYSLEFFLSLEYRNERKLLVTMFDVVRKIAQEPRLGEKVKDALVSPYVEPIVKSVLLGEILAADPDAAFEMDSDYKPFTSDCAERLKPGYSAGYYQAYAMVAALNGTALHEFIALAERTEFAANGIDERDKAFYLFKRVSGGRADERAAYALGYSSKAAAMRAYKSSEKTAVEKVN